jgi:hypothetical protein
MSKIKSFNEHKNLHTYSDIMEFIDRRVKELANQLEEFPDSPHIDLIQARWDEVREIQKALLTDR